MLDEKLHNELAGDCEAMYCRANAFLKLDRKRWALEHYQLARTLAKDPVTAAQCDRAIAWLTKSLQARAEQANSAPAQSNQSNAVEVDPGKAKLSETATRGSVKPGPMLQPTPYDLSLITIQQRSAETDNVYKAVSTAVAAMPLRIKQQIDEAGIRWIICSTLVDYDPALVDAKARGWGPGLDFRYVAGTYSLKHNKILIAERALRTSDGVLSERGHRLETTLHETGHAYDKVLNYYSRDPAFRAAYEADCARLADAQRPKLKYYLQAGNAGPSETFAELFDKCIMQTANLPLELPNDITTTFPNCCVIMKRLLR